MRAVTCDGWSAIETAEIALVRERGRTRTKIADRAALLAASLSEEGENAQWAARARSGDLKSVAVQEALT